MSKRHAILAASSALATLSVPVIAQDGWVDEPLAGAPYAEVGTADAAHVTVEPLDYDISDVAQTHGVDVIVDDAVLLDAVLVDAVLLDAAMEPAVLEGDGTAAHAGRHGQHHGRQHPAPAHPQAPRLAYGAAERAEWLSQCRALHTRPVEPVAYYEDDADEGLIGGLLGAVVGGVIGNRVNDGDRLLGTVIGAGVGGIAGAAIGSVIDGLADDADEREVVQAPEEPRFDYCEAYLLNYERGYGTPTQIAYAPVMLAPAAQAPLRPHHEQRRRYRVIEEEIEVDVPATAAPANSRH